jgi:hypothetical protein
VAGLGSMASLRTVLIVPIEASGLSADSGSGYRGEKPVLAG